MKLYVDIGKDIYIFTHRYIHIHTHFFSPMVNPAQRHSNDESNKNTSRHLSHLLCDGCVLKLGLKSAPALDTDPAEGPLECYDGHLLYSMA